MKIFIHIREFFHHRRSERSGTVLLLILSMLVLLLPDFGIPSQPQSIDFEKLQKEIQQWKSKKAKLARQRTGKERTDRLDQMAIAVQQFSSQFTFDPNQISKDELIEAGFPMFFINNLMNYRNAGGRFYKKEDLQKLYVVDNAIYERLAPYLRLASASPKFVTSATAKNAERADQVGPKLFVFDPNEATRAELSQLGLSARVVNTIVKFRNKGGKFYQKDDLAKIYGIDNQQFKILKPYIEIQRPVVERPTFQSAGEGPVASQESIFIDINQASAADWQKLRGIGPYYAKRITEYRDKLGGFVNIHQVSETYRLPDSTFSRIEPFLQASALLRYIPVNRATAKELATHPYISWKYAQIIVQYRRNHGPLNSIRDMKDIKALSIEFLKRIEPYLNFEKEED